MILDGCFDNGLRRAEVATRYKHGAGPTTYWLVFRVASDFHPKGKAYDYSSRLIMDHLLRGVARI